MDLPSGVVLCGFSKGHVVLKALLGIPSAEQAVNDKFKALLAAGKELHFLDAGSYIGDGFVRKYSVAVADSSVFAVAIAPSSGSLITSSSFLLHCCCIVIVAVSLLRRHRRDQLFHRPRRGQLLQLVEGRKIVSLHMVLPARVL